MSTFDNNSLKKISLKSTTTRQFYTPRTVRINSYLTSTSIHNDTKSDNFSKTTYELDIQSIEN